MLALQLAALRAKEKQITQGLFCPEKKTPFASVTKDLWGKM